MGVTARDEARTTLRAFPDQDAWAGISAERKARLLATSADPWSNLLWPRSLEDAGWTWDQ